MILIIVRIVLKKLFYVYTIINAFKPNFLTYIVFAAGSVYTFVVVFAYKLWGVV